MLGRKKTDKKRKRRAQMDMQEIDRYADVDLLEVTTLQLNESKPVTQQLPKQNQVVYRDAGRSTIQIGTASIIGSRRSQQDSVFGYVSGSCALGIVCDGMGGLCGGEIASRVALESLADAWLAQTDVWDIPDFFRREAVSADEKVYQQEAADGRRLEAGTTIVAAIVRQNELYWLSVGDSRLYFIRGQEILSLNVEHNYRMELNTLLRQGLLTAQEYEAEEYRAEALTSYLGIGDLSVMDISPRAYPLVEGDIILLASDGLYRSLNEEEILTIVQKNRQNMQQAAQALTAAVDGRKKQDNTSVVILRYGMETQTLP